MRGSVDGDGSADWLDEDVLDVVDVLDDVVLLAADVELLVDGVVAGAVDELDGVELGAVGCVLVELEW